MYYRLEEEEEARPEEVVRDFVMARIGGYHASQFYYGYELIALFCDWEVDEIRAIFRKVEEEIGYR